MYVLIYFFQKIKRYLITVLLILFTVLIFKYKLWQVFIPIVGLPVVVGFDFLVFLISHIPDLFAPFKYVILRVISWVTGWSLFGGRILLINTLGDYIEFINFYTFLKYIVWLFFTGTIMLLVFVIFVYFFKFFLSLFIIGIFFVAICQYFYAAIKAGMIVTSIKDLFLFKNEFCYYTYSFKYQLSEVYHSIEELFHRNFYSKVRWGIKTEVRKIFLNINRGLYEIFLYVNYYTYILDGLKLFFYCFCFIGWLPIVSLKIFIFIISYLLMCIVEMFVDVSLFGVEEGGLGITFSEEGPVEDEDYSDFTQKLFEWDRADFSVDDKDNWWWYFWPDSDFHMYYPFEYYSYLHKILMCDLNLINIIYMIFDTLLYDHIMELDFNIDIMHFIRLIIFVCLAIDQLSFSELFYFIIMLDLVVLYDPDHATFLMLWLVACSMMVTMSFYLQWSDREILHEHAAGGSKTIFHLLFLEMQIILKTIFNKINNIFFYLILFCILLYIFIPS